MITKAIETAILEKKEREWKKIYWCIDLHSTIITGTYKKDNAGARFAVDAIEVLRHLTDQEDQVLILWTSSYKTATKKIVDRLKKSGVRFDYFNENPECKNTELCDFSSKFYFNILLDDRAGFDMSEDWTKIKRFLIEKRFDSNPRNK